MDRRDWLPVAAGMESAIRGIQKQAAGLAVVRTADEYGGWGSLRTAPTRGSMGHRRWDTLTGSCDACPSSTCPVVRRNMSHALADLGIANY